MSVDFFIGKYEAVDGKVVVNRLTPPNFDPKKIVGYYDNSDPESAIYDVNPWEMNCSNGNAAHLLSLIGYSFDICSTLNPAETISRIDHALSMIKSDPSFGARETVRVVVDPKDVMSVMVNSNIEDALAISEVPLDQGIQVTFCGVGAEYSIQRLTELRSLAEIAQREEAVLVYA
jgi:hypothetical protein